MRLIFEIKYWIIFVILFLNIYHTFIFNYGRTVFLIMCYFQNDTILVPFIKNCKQNMWMLSNQSLLKILGAFTAKLLVLKENDPI